MLLNSYSTKMFTLIHLKLTRRYKSAKKYKCFYTEDVASYQYKNIDEYVASIVSYIIEYNDYNVIKMFSLIYEL